MPLPEPFSASPLSNQSHNFFKHYVVEEMDDTFSKTNQLVTRGGQSNIYFQIV